MLVFHLFSGIEHVEAIGRWAVDREHGQQFKADELKTTYPASVEGIEKYLASGAICSVSPKLAAKIVSVYKERTLEICLNLIRPSTLRASHSRHEALWDQAPRHILPVAPHEDLQSSYPVRQIGERRVHLVHRG